MSEITLEQPKEQKIPRIIWQTNFEIICLISDDLC